MNTGQEKEERRDRAQGEEGVVVQRSLKKERKDVGIFRQVVSLFSLKFMKTKAKKIEEFKTRVYQLKTRNTTNFLNKF